MAARVIVLLSTILAVAALAASCEPFPKDSQETLEKVRNNRLVVGITENPPYVVFKEGQPAGREVELIEAFAQTLNAEVAWVKGSEETILTLLKSGQVDLAAGGFNHSSVWKKEVHFVEPHDTLVYKWGVPAGAGLPENLKEKQVYVKQGSVAGAYVHDAKGKPVYMDSLAGNEPLVAAPLTDLQEMGYAISEKTLKKDKISLAIRKGENAFLESLWRFISAYETGKRNNG